MKEKEKQNGTGGLICAAGCSSRMGACKPLLPLGNETVLRLGVLTMTRAGVSPVIVVTGREAAAVAASVADLGAETVENREYASTQMFDSVKMGLRLLRGRCSRVLFTPADVPLYREETLKMLIRTPAPVCVPSYRGKTGHPVCFDADLIDAVLSYEGSGGLGGAFASLGKITAAECADEGILIEADTPGDYEKMKEYYARALSDPAW